MLHQVLPPEPPTLVKPLQAANSVADPSSDKLALAVGQFSCVSCQDTQAKTLTTANKSQQLERRTPTSSTLNSVPSTSVNQAKNQLAASKALSKPSTPESFPPEFSPNNVSKSASVLGQLSIGYPVQFESNSGQAASAEFAQTPTKTNNLSASQQAQLPQPQQSNSPNQNTAPATEQPIKIEFNSGSETNEAPRPSTIEFKSRNAQEQSTPPPSGNGSSTNGQQSQPSTTPPANTPPETRRVIEVVADRQEYDEQRRVVTAEGNVVVRFDGAVVDADRLQVNLDNLIAVGSGNVALTRGDQVLRGQRFTYNFVQDNGELFAGSGEIFIPTVGQDFSFLPNGIATGVPRRPPSDRITANQPVAGVGSPGGVNITVGGRRDVRNLPGVSQQDGGLVRRLRFEAARVDFYPRGWQARDVRLTNDPFSPPELEIRADKVTLTRETPLRDRINTQGQRLVLDQKTSVPIPRDQQTIDRSEREVTPGLVSIGFDGDQRGGLFVERSFQPFSTDNVGFSVTPQFFVQKAVQGNADNIAGLFGLRTKLNAVLSPQTVVEGSGVLTSFDLSQVEDNLRASLRLRQLFGNVANPYNLSLEYSYRDRLYNGTLGYQTVQSNLGGVITSPVIPLGKSGINLRYQGSAQYINANTDRQDLLEAKRENDRISLSRVQGSATLDGGLVVWQGKALPPTPTEGLRYTANSIVPYVRAFGNVTGTSSYYSSGDSQNTLFGTVGLEGQFGNFSRPFFDYTAFNVSYSQGFNSGLSPFKFDRSVDNRVLNAGITQQIYGPFRFGFQTSINLDTGERSSTDYIVEYSRRTYGITLRYNPVLELGGISFRISDFNWTGGTDPFSDPSEIKPVVGGVRQDN